jgi:glycosyltransferase involved in cell wall biosynthesis
MLQISIIIPVYNRPEEIDELLESLTLQTDNDFEIVVVEDGSKLDSKHIIEKYSDKLDISYFYIQNSGPGPARNYGVKHSKGEFVVIVDSDCILPKEYIATIKKELSQKDVDVFGGPDKALPSFTPTQKAINYSMTSLLTTGGIRGNKKTVGKYYPRSFNMGIRRTVFDALNGFAPIRLAEDTDFSIRVYKEGYKVAFFESVYVYHKRRSTLKSFYKQVHNFGTGRINLIKAYPSEIKIEYFFPALFLLFLIGSIIIAPWCIWGISLILLYFLLILITSTIQNRSIKVGALSVVTSFIQHTGYAIGFISNFWKRFVLKK